MPHAQAFSSVASLARATRPAQGDGAANALSSAGSSGKPSCKPSAKPGAKPGACARTPASAVDACPDAVGNCAAIAPGLVWVSDTQPGIQRLRHGDSFRYRDAKGRAVRDEAVLQRIRKLAIPPAYVDVWICSQPNGHLQATGRDARGRKQYRYHADWHAGRGQTKFDRLRDFARVLPRLRRAVQRRLGGSVAQPTREQVLATLVRLLDTTWMRIGNDEYARTNGSYGLSTLRAHHVGVRGSALRLSFTGKSGVQHEVKLTDRRVARVLRRCRELPGQELFRYLGDDGFTHRLGSSDVNAWLAASAERAGAAAGKRAKAVCITAKDFRTWHGSVQALDLTLAACQAMAREDAEAAVTPKMVLAEVARLLGNTPAVCRKAYIHPAVLAFSDALGSAEQRAVLLQQPWVQAPPPGSGLALAERRLLGLLAAAGRKRRDRAARTVRSAQVGTSPAGTSVRPDAKAAAVSTPA